MEGPFNHSDQRPTPSAKGSFRRVSLRAVVCLGLMLVPSLLFAADEGSKSEKGSALPLWEAVAKGFIEGMTEYLPVSSTGHLLIFDHWMGRDPFAPETEASDALTICIQSGAILAVILLYFQRLRQMVSGLLGGDPAGRQLFIQLVIAFLPAAIVGLLFHKLVKEHLFKIVPVTIAIFTGAILILAMPRPQKMVTPPVEKDLTDLRWSESLLIGIFQCLAFWPGFSRSLATILGCRVMKLKMAASVEFSFLLGLLTLGAATAKEGLSHGSKIVEYYGVVSPLLALFVAFVSAIISVKFMVGILNRYGLAPFAIYRLLLAGCCLMLWWNEFFR